MLGGVEVFLAYSHGDQSSNVRGVVRKGGDSKSLCSQNEHFDVLFLCF